MNFFKSVIALLLVLPSLGFSQDDFTRPLPEKEFSDQITPQKFPNSDAVILIKEQSFQETADEFFYYGIDIPTTSTVISKVLIVKLLNESGVKRYGNFEYEYEEPLDDIVKNGFTAVARVLKPDGKIYVMPEDEIKIIVTAKDKHGKPFMKKALFNVPNLAAGDILQLEYQTVSKFSSSNAGVFYYDDEDITIFSNLYITLPAQENYAFQHYPQHLVGEPKVVQLSKRYGDGKTYFWSLQKLKAVPSEPFSLPFSERATKTRFFMLDRFHKDYGWFDYIRWYYDEVLDKGSIGPGEIKLLGFTKDEQNIDINKIDSLYTSLRKNFILQPSNYAFPDMEDIDDAFDEKKGSASDLAYIMYKILEKWKVKVKGVLIRDRRTGTYDNMTPTLSWFTRLGVLAEVDGKEKLYDFDPSLPNIPENPWYLNKTRMLIIEDKAAIPQKDYSFENSPESNVSSEIHKLSFTQNSELKDSVELSFTGSFAQRLRHHLYKKDKSEAEEYFRSRIASNCIPKPESIQLNNYFDVSELKVNASGVSQFKSEVIDSFLTVNVGNIILSEFRDKLKTAKRYNDIYFDAPNSYVLQYEIPIPEGYRPYKQPAEHYRNIKSDVNFSISYSTSDSKILVKVCQVYGHEYYPLSDYKNIMDHLDNSIKDIGQDLIFVKNQAEVVHNN